MLKQVFVAALAGLLLTTVVAAGDDVVRLRSGDVKPLAIGDPRAPEANSSRRWVVRFNQPTGMFERGSLSSAGVKIEAPLSGQAYLVTIPDNRSVDLTSIPGVDWATPFRAEHKISPEIVDAQPVEGAEEILVLLHLFTDANAQAVADELTAAGLDVKGVGSGARFDRILLSMDATQVNTWSGPLAERDDVFWVGRRYRRTLQNSDVVWVDQSGLDGNMLTPIHDRGIRGEGQIGAVLDTGVDADACQFRDGVLGLPPTNTGAGTTVDLAQRKIIAVDFLDPGENPADPTHWDTQGHGTHVAGTLVGDNLATPIGHDLHDGLAPAAKVVIQDAGYAPDACGDLPGIGCPVTDLIPIFQQAYDQGARVHNNSWNDNENAAVQNTYTDASEDVDEFIWNNPDFLIMVGAGNNAFGGFGTMGSPGTCKNGMSVGATYNGEFARVLSDISAWGPTDDGRIKPDILSPGASINSAENDFDVTTDNCGTRGSTGTSHASPGAGAGALLLRQYFLEGWYPTGTKNAPDGFNPTAALVKAMIINSGVPIDIDAEGRDIELGGIEMGWGRMLLDNVMHFGGQQRGLFIDENAVGLASPADPPITYLLEVLDASEPLKITLAWTDFPSTPAASIHLVNDLDLRVDGNTGGFWGNSFKNNESWPLFGVDRLNNIEQVLILTPTPGIYSIQVSAHAVPSGPQPFALVVSGAVSVSSGPRPGYFSHVIDDSGPNGNGDGILDPGETATLPITVRNSGDSDATSVTGQLFGVGPVKVYQASASYPNVLVNQQQTSMAPHYEVTLDPTASCGDWVGANMALSGAGFNVGSGFTMDVGLYEGGRPSTDTPVVVPKSSPAGVWSFLNVPDDFIPSEVDITFNLDHEDLTQVRVVLYHPDNSLAILHDFTPGNGIHTTYDEITQPAVGTMETFVGKSPQGTWRIKVIDDSGCCGVPDGTIENWTLTFKADVPWDCNPVSCGEAVPPPVGDTLTVSKSGGSDVQVGWTGVGGASNYNVWRAHDSQMATAVHVGATGGSTSLVDGGAQSLPGVHYYVARSVNSCRWESD